METVIVEGKTKPRKPTIIEGLPGLGFVGKIAALYIIRQLKAKRIATLYSPHFPHYAIVDERGLARLLKNDFYYWRSPDGERDLVIITGDCQPQTTYGQYEVADKIIAYAKKTSAKVIITIGGYGSAEKVEPKVVGAATRDDLIRKLQAIGVIVDKVGMPIVGVAGLIMALAKLNGVDAVCLLGETAGYALDPKAAKCVLQILSKFIGVDVDLKEIEKEVERMRKIEERIKETEKTIEAALKLGKIEEKVSYIG
jgi:uncharacterized protein (TIGR00162 family)